MLNKDFSMQTRRLFKSALLVSIVLATTMGPISAQEWRRFPLQVFGSGNAPRAITQADFNADGITDLAVANELSDDLSVLLGKPDGSFLLAASYAAGDQPVSIATADFDGDVITDLVVANLSSNNVSVLLGNEDTSNPGNGDGTFAVQQTYNAGGGPVFVTVGDFDDDGATDLATANLFSGNVSILLGGGNGTFPSEATFSVGTNPFSVITGDFNDDGITDLATTINGGVTILRGIEDSGNPGSGNGTFATEGPYTVEPDPREIRSGDFNGDGITDLVTANIGKDNVSILLGNEDSSNPGSGDGTFAAQTTYPAGDGPFAVITADFNDDGITDIATSNEFSDNVSILLGNEDSGNAGVGDGTFSAPVDYGTGRLPRSLTAGNFNADGITDLAVANFDDDRISILFGNESDANPGAGDGTFIADIQPLTFAVGNRPRSVTSADFNGDGIADLVTANANSDTLSVLLGKGDPTHPAIGDGTFATSVAYPAGSFPVSVTSGDFDGDGIIDLGAANGSSSGQVSIYLGNEDSSDPGTGDGTFGSPSFFSVGTTPQDITTGDFNDDGIPDLVVVNLFSQNASVLLGNGDGTFLSATNYTVGINPYCITGGDFDGDGITDLAIANNTNSTVSILLGTEDTARPGFGDGTFGPQATFPTGGGPISLSSGDFNDDGILDLVTADFDSDTLSLLLGNPDASDPSVGDGTFAAPVSYPVLNGPRDVMTGDFNLDGITDVAISNLLSSKVSVLLGNESAVNAGTGDGTFAPQLIFDSDQGAYNLATGDFNGDSNVDLAIANEDDDNVSLLLNLGLTEPDPVLTPNALAFGDFELGSSPSTSSVAVDVTGDADLITTPTLTNDGSGAFSLTSTLASPLAQGTSDTLEVSFAPTSLGFTTGSLTLATNDISSPTITIALSGNGVDTQEPTSTATGPSGSLTQPSALFDVAFTTSDGGSGVANVELFYQRNGAGYLSYGTFTTSPVSFDTTGTGGDGSYDFYTIATDTAGNTETKTATNETSVNFNDNTNVNDWFLLDI